MSQVVLAQGLRCGQGGIIWGLTRAGGAISKLIPRAVSSRPQVLTLWASPHNRAAGLPRAADPREKQEGRTHPQSEVTTHPWLLPHSSTGHVTNPDTKGEGLHLGLWLRGRGGGALGPSWRLLTTSYSCRPRPVFKGPRAKMVFYILKGCKRENEEYVTETIHGLQSPNYLLYGSL